MNLEKNNIVQNVKLFLDFHDPAKTCTKTEICVNVCRDAHREDVYL